MMQHLTISNLGLDSPLPDVLYVLHQPSTDRYACYEHDRVHGLACFSRADSAVSFARALNQSDLRLHRVTFDEACDTAQGRPMPVVSIMVMDQGDAPHIHYVR